MIYRLQPKQVVLCFCIYNRKSGLLWVSANFSMIFPDFIDMIVSMNRLVSQTTEPFLCFQETYWTTYFQHCVECWKVRLFTSVQKILKFHRAVCFVNPGLQPIFSSATCNSGLSQYYPIVDKPKRKLTRITGLRDRIQPISIL